MTDIERDIDFIITKTKQLFGVIEKEQFDLLNTKELGRQQLIDQFFINYSQEQLLDVSDKLDQLLTISTEVTELCENCFEQTKQNILKIKKSDKIKKAYR